MVERVVVGPWKTNCYIFSSTKKECIIIDPGGSEDEIASRVDVLNMVPVGIALTHGHIDHLAALGKLRDAYAARGYKLPIAINPSDRRFLGIGGMDLHKENLEVLGLDETTFFGADSQELPKADVRLREGDRVFQMDLVVLETPGHTPGSVCLYSEKEGILFSGDTVFFDAVGNTDLPGGSEKKLRDSIQKKIAVLPPETRVFPGHGPFTTVEREKRGNPYFRDMLQEARPAATRPMAMPAVSASRTSTGTGAGGAKRPLVGATRPAAGAQGVKSQGAVASRSHGGAKASSAQPKRASAKHPSVKRPAAKAAKARAAVAKHARAAAKGSRGKSVQGKLKGISAGKKRVQATRSTKAPGAGRKPSR